MKLYSVPELQEIFNTELQIRIGKLKEKHPVNLYNPAEYALSIGGKRLRPVLLLLSYNMFSGSIQSAIPAAIAIEVFHNFTLLHDDIMDKAEVRRNKPTVHKKFSKNNAILSGDVMAFMSYQYLLETSSGRLADVMALFTQTAIEVCEGQQFDMEFENRVNVPEDEYIEMTRLKTAVLLACGLKAGALLAEANDKFANQLYEYGLNLGLAFQLQDDLLDSFGNQDSFGKKIGGDILANKKTFLLIKAIEKASGGLKSELLGWLNKTGYHPDEKIEAVLRIYNLLDIKEITKNKIDFYFQKCNLVVNQLAIEESRKNQLIKISQWMLKRNY